MMKKSRFPYALALLVLATSCNTKTCPDDVVCESYVHRYGVPLKADEWTDRGQDGQIVSTRRDGVVVTKCYEAGQLHGECSYTYPHSDTIQKREFYSQNKLNQEVHYFSNGIPQKQLDYDSAGNKTLTKWYDNGSPQRKETYNKDTLVSGEYYNTANQVESKVTDGNGIRTRRDSYGQLQSNDKIADGQMALRKTFHPNGVPESVTPYNGGVIHGQRRTYTMSGEPVTIETWNNNVQHGNTEVYQHGEKFADQPYVNGVKHGIERRYRDGGDVLVQEVNWENNNQHGPTHTYIGEAKNTDWYFQNKQVNKQTFDALSNQ
jgi:antitoxin component YwqK of YwqJK toxin-antitoxin module